MDQGQLDTWPAGANWTFFGTVAEDATGGTHVCSLVVTPGLGNEMEVLYGSVVNGNTATAETVAVFIDDGTNQITELLLRVASTTANNVFNFPAGANIGSAGSRSSTGPGVRFIVSGTMRLVLQVSTAAISVTQTFAVTCRIKGAMPTAVLSDTVGAPVLTTTTNKVF